MPNWKKVIVSGSNASLNSLDIVTSLYVTGSTVLTGSLQYIDGNQQNGYVLTTDANGNATWQMAGAASASKSFVTWSIDNTDTEYTWAGTDGNIEAETPNDTVTLVAGTNIVLDRDATNDAIRITSTATGGGSSRITGSVTTTNATSTLLDTIDTLTANSIHLIEVYVTGKETGSVSQWGTWKRTLAVTNISGTASIQQVSADFDKTSVGLKANDVSFAASSSAVNINVSGIASTTINWNSKYEIISVS